MAFKDLCFAIVALSIAIFTIGSVEANSNSSQQITGTDKKLSLDDGNDVKEANAVYFITPAWFHGFTASMTVYNPTVTVGQSSKTYISIQNTFNKRSDGIDEIQAGWIIDPWKYGDSRPRFFVYYKGAGGRSCVNTCSDGFRSIQGSYLAPADVLDANNQITIKFLKDNSTGDWGVYVGPGAGDTYLSRIGYFPKYLFTGLADSGNYAEFGGEVKFLSSLKSPPMGNGIYAKELQRNGDPLPAIMKNIYYIRPDGWYLDRYYSRHSYQNCYGLGKLMVQDNSFGYGGPGGCTS